jgi:sn-2 palmitoyl-lipid 9-desaturase
MSVNTESDLQNLSSVSVPLTDPSCIDITSTSRSCADTSAAGPFAGVSSTAAEIPYDSAPAGKAGRWANGLEWPTIIWIVVLHAGALAAPFFFTWHGLVLAFVLAWLTGGLGVCLGYHRLLAHGSYKTFPAVRRLLALLGTLAGEGPPITWTAVHRKHHQFADKEGDPHTPRDGGWWSHIGWLFPRPQSREWHQMIARYAKDVLKDPFMRLLDKTFLAWHIALGLALFTTGWLVWDIHTGMSLLIYGMFVRLVYVLHITWAVNSASHMWGYRNYETRDDSRNLWWVGLLAYGEGWHNNHHAFPGRARHGHRWWELDLTYMVICLLEFCGLAWNVTHGRKRLPEKCPAPAEEVPG